MSAAPRPPLNSPTAMPNLSFGELPPRVVRKPSSLLTPSSYTPAAGNSIQLRTSAAMLSMLPVVPGMPGIWSVGLKLPPSAALWSRLMTVAISNEIGTLGELGAAAGAIAAPCALGSATLGPYTPANTSSDF